MDFNAFDTVSSANKGAWLHLRSPLDGELLFEMKEDPDTGKPVPDETKPCRVRVLGAEGKVAQEMVKASRKELVDGKEEDAQDRIRREAATLIVDFENINRGDKPAKAPDDCEWFCGLQKAITRKGVHPGFSEQVREFSLTRMSDLGNARSD